MLIGTSDDLFTAQDEVVERLGRYGVEGEDVPQKKAKMETGKKVKKKDSEESILGDMIDDITSQFYGRAMEKLHQHFPPGHRFSDEMFVHKVLERC